MGLDVIPEFVPEFPQSGSVAEADVVEFSVGDFLLLL